MSLSLWVRPMVYFRDWKSLVWSLPRKKDLCINKAHLRVLITRQVQVVPSTFLCSDLPWKVFDTEIKAIKYEANFIWLFPWPSPLSFQQLFIEHPAIVILHIIHIVITLKNGCSVKFQEWKPYKHIGVRFWTKNLTGFSDQLAPGIKW